MQMVSLKPSITSKGAVMLKGIVSDIFKCPLYLESQPSALRLHDSRGQVIGSELLKNSDQSPMNKLVIALS